jgi:hypothetical protein
VSDHDLSPEAFGIDDMVLAAPTVMQDLQKCGIEVSAKDHTAPAWAIQAYAELGILGDATCFRCVKKLAARRELREAWYTMFCMNVDVFQRIAFVTERCR